jgi:hypothetical protein
MCKSQLQIGQTVQCVLYSIGYGLDDEVFESRQGKRFYLLHNAQTGCLANPASYSMGSGALSVGAKWPTREANHLTYI